MAIYETKMDIGQKFWTVEGDDKRRVVEHKVEEIRIWGRESCDIEYLYDLWPKADFSLFVEEDIGRSIFLSREDAELVKCILDDADQN